MARTHAPDPASRLREAGLRVTGPRVAVLEALQRDRLHLPAESVADAVRPRLRSVSMQAIYNTLNTLTESGLLRRFDPGRGPARYELRAGDNHHHLVCRSCDAVADVDCAVGDTPCLTAADDLGYEIDEAEVIYRGLCPACASSASAAGKPARQQRQSATI